jgi:hypothetical protein
MRTLLFPLALMAITFSACAQESGLDKFYNKYKNSGNVDGNISIDPGFLLKASFSSGEKDGERAGGKSNWLHKVTRLRVLILDGKKTPSAVQDWKVLSRCLREEQFEELVSVRNGKDNMQLLDKERKDGLKEIVFLAAGEDGGGLFIEFRGNFTASDLENIQSALQDNHKKQERTDEQ